MKGNLLITVLQALKMPYTAGYADFSWRYMDSDRPDFTTPRTTDFSYGLELTTQLPGRIDLWTEITMTSRHGYLDASMNDDCLA